MHYEDIRILPKPLIVVAITTFANGLHALLPDMDETYEYNTNNIQNIRPIPNGFLTPLGDANILYERTTAQWRIKNSNKNPRGGPPLTEEQVRQYDKYATMVCPAAAVLPMITDDNSQIYVLSQDTGDQYDCI